MAMTALSVPAGSTNAFSGIIRGGAKNIDANDAFCSPCAKRNEPLAFFLAFFLPSGVEWKSEGHRALIPRNRGRL